MKQSIGKTPASSASRKKSLRDDHDVSGQRLREGLIALLIIGAVILFFWPVSNATFMTYDDLQNIAHNPRLNPPTWGSIPLFWKAPYEYLYIPLTYTIWTLLAMVSRTAKPDEIGLTIDASSFHALNLLFHVAAALVAYRLLRRLVKRPWPAAAGALLFALHPVQVEPVAWATGLKDVMSGLLSLIAMWQYVAFVQSRQTDSDKQHRTIAIGHYLVASVAFILALLSKPSAAMVPIAAFLVLPLTEHSADDSKKVSGTFFDSLRKRFLTPFLTLVPWLLLAVGCLLITRHAQPVRASTVMNAGALWQRPLIAADATAFYLYKLAIPFHLMPQYDHTPQAAIARGWIYWAWIVPAAVLIPGLLFRKRALWGLVALAIFVAAILPISGLVPFAFEELSLVADRYLYFAMLGPALALAFALTHVRRRWPAIIVSAWLLILGVLSLIQSTRWHDTRTLFEYELAVNPNSDVAYNNLSDYYYFRNQLGDLNTALDYADTMIQRFPQNAYGYLTRGSTLTKMGRFEEAIASLRKGLKLQPKDVTGLGNLAGALSETKQNDQAIQVCQQLIALAPDSDDTHVKFGVVLVHAQRHQQALVEFQNAVRLNPENPQAQTFLGFALEHEGRPEEAAEHFRAALSINPQFTPAAQGLARVGGM